MQPLLVSFKVEGVKVPNKTVWAMTKKYKAHGTISHPRDLEDHIDHLTF